MNECRVEEIGLSDDEATQVAALINASFPENPDVGAERVRANTNTIGGAPSIYVAAKIGSEIVGFNAFISHTLWLNREPVAAYQSCWTATSHQHRGKGIFQKLIDAGREIMRARGAAFLFGFPNPNSYPIFVHKLGFRELNSVKWQMPLLPLASRRWVARAPIDVTDAVLQDERQLIDLKRREHGDALLEFAAGESTMWGVRRWPRRIGLSFPVFEVGGIDLRDEDDLRTMLGRLGRASPRCVTAQFVGVENSSYNPLFRNLTVVSPPLIIDDFTLDTRGLRFNFFSGVRDYF